MRSVGEGALTLDDSVRNHLDSCLGCRACETACPSGVQYGDILEEFREKMEVEAPRPRFTSFARKQLLDTLTSPARLAASLKAARVMERFTGKMEALPLGLASLLTGRSGERVTLPSLSGDVKVGRLPAVNPAIGDRRYTVAMLAGCVMRVLFHRTNQATVRVLQQNGCEVLVPSATGCCGAFHLHMGYASDAKSRARALLQSLRGVEFDAFIVNSAGCGSTLKGYGHLLEDDPVFGDEARHFAAKVKDVSEWLDEIGIVPPTRPYARRVAYHDACHLAHGQGVRSAPRKLLAAIPDLELVELPESDTCCGSAGVYNMTQPQMAARLLERKVDFIAQTGAQVVATGNPGCLAWIEQGLRARGLEIEIRHPIEILDEAYPL
jgi:glycolate oxidase iron-sulfur subunit